MAENHTCDICSLPMNHIRFIFGFLKDDNIARRKFEQEAESLSYNEIADQIAKGRQYALQNTEHYEICEGCKKVFVYLLNMRKIELLKIKEKIDEMKEGFNEEEK